MNYFINEGSRRLYYLKTILLSTMLLCLEQYSYAQAQEAIILNLIDIEEQFLIHNLDVLAAQYDIDIADATILQAQAWPNPELSIEDIQLFKPNDSEEIPGLFNSNFWKNRTFGIALTQNFQLGNKRKYHIQQQKHEKEKAQLEFRILLYTLKKDLRSTMATWYFKHQKLKDIKTQYEYIQLLHQQHLILFEQGQTSKAQVFRINSLLLGIAKDLKEQELKLTSLEMDIKEILHIPLDTPISLHSNTYNQFKVKVILLPIQELLLKGKEQQQLFSWWNTHLKTYELQEKIEKVATIPDLDISMNYDRGGNTHLNFFGLGLTMDLPIWDRNKGNRRIAQWEKEKEKSALEQFTIEWEKRIRMTYETIKQQQFLYEKINLRYLEEMESMILGLQENLINKNISLIEYLDYFEAFKESKEYYYDLQLSIFEEKETLNFLLGEAL